jgi:hypothetical protein
MNDMPDHEEGLKGHHHLVVLHIVANQHQKFLYSHDEYPPWVMVALAGD